MIKDFQGVQYDILTSQNSNTLVSAGAGSGKTTIMIEKIADLIINQNVPVENMLVVTFTVLASQEMKDRLIEKLNSILETSEDKTKILQLISQVKTASIDTIDGFSSKTIKKYFYALEINPNIDIISDTTRDYYITIAMKKTLDEYSQDESKIAQLLDIFGGDQRNLNTLSKLILQTYNNIINLEDYNAFLENAIKEYQPNSKSEKHLNDWIKYKINEAKSTAIEGNNNISKDKLSLCQNWVKQLEDFNSLNLKSSLQNLKNLVVPDIKKKDGELFSRSIGEIKDLIKKLKIEGIDENFNVKNIKICDYLTNFIEILKNFIKNYSLLKQKNNLIDFNDLNRLMLKLLQNKKIKDELQNQYKYIFVDEYQDVNPLQDNLISQLVNNQTKLFLVGDVKQSIYGFRGANPNSFLNRYASYKSNKEEGEAFNMNLNFRSNPKILNFVNQVFSRIMTSDEADIDYKTDCIIEPKREDIDDDKVSILLAKLPEKQFAHGLYSVKNANYDEDEEGEALLVLTTITQLIGKLFYDAKLKQTRLLQYSDIAILSRSCEGKEAQKLIELLKSNNVPLKTSTKLNITENEGVKLVLSILKCVNQTADDVDMLAFFNALTSLTLDEIIELKQKDNSFISNLEKNDNPNIKQGYDILDKIRLNSIHSLNSELIRYILNECGLKYYLLLKSNGQKVVDDIQEFIGTISSLEDGLNLSEFIRVVESNLTKSNEVESLDAENSVTIQTIHKSKGLEYPVVILFNTAKQFNYITDNPLINFNADYGLGVDFYEYETRTKTNSVPRFVMKRINDNKSYKEEMRLLYVALTRAKNKLIITGTYGEKFTEGNLKNTNFLNMIVGGFNLHLGENEFEFCRIHLFEEVKGINSQIENENRNIIDKYSHFSYSNQDKFSIPLKNTVTGLNSEYSQTNGFNTKQWLKSEVQTEADEDKALVGTHYHKALESLDFSLPYKKTTDFKDVDYKKIELAYEKISPMVKDARLHKEAEFMMYLPYNQLVKSEIDDKVLVQGVVDLIIEYENSITIVDYKFSSFPVPILKQKYAEQLALYKLAVEKAFNKKVDHMFIYSINAGELG